MSPATPSMRASRRAFRRLFSEDVFEFLPSRVKPIVNAHLAGVRGEVLDAACGSGNAFWDGAAFQCSSSTGLDLDGAALARNTIHGRLLRGDLHDLDETAAYDGILSVYTWEHLRDPGKVLLNFHRALRPGGVVVIVAPSRWYYVSVAARLIPGWLRDLAWRLAKGLPGAPYPTYFRLCSRRSLVRAAEAAGFRLLHFSAIDAPPLWFAKVPPLFVLACGWMALCNRVPLLEPLRGTFVAALGKEEDVAPGRQCTIGPATGTARSRG